MKSKDKRLNDRRIKKPWSPRRELEEVDNDRWQCKTCELPALENSEYCMTCKKQWESNDRIAGFRFFS